MPGSLAARIGPAANPVLVRLRLHFAGNFLVESGPLRGDVLAVSLGIDEGGDAHIIDSQGSGEIEVHRFDLLEAEGYALRALGSETFDRPLPVQTVLDAARKRRKERPTIYHWDFGGSDYR